MTSWPQTRPDDPEGPRRRERAEPPGNGLPGGSPAREMQHAARIVAFWDGGYPLTRAGGNC